jgi:hypothetical protein
MTTVTIPGEAIQPRHGRARGGRGPPRDETLDAVLAHEEAWQTRLALARWRLRSPAGAPPLTLPLRPPTVLSRSIRKSLLFFIFRGEVRMFASPVRPLL